MTSQLLLDARRLEPAIREGILDVTERIERAADSAHLDPSGISLVAVTKGRSPAVTLATWLAGARFLGENRADELVAKAAAISPALSEIGDRGDPPPEWHFIGHLQRNKARRVLGVISLLHSLESLELAEELVRRCEAADIALPKCLVEVNIAGEEGKYGVAPASLADFIGQSDVTPAGLMCMAPRGANETEAHSVFAELAQLRHDMKVQFPELDLVDLSMGMTDDFEAAVAEGATIVRVGRAIFAHLR